MVDEKVIDWLLEQSTRAYESEREFTSKLRDRAGFILGFLVTPIGGAIISLITTFKGDFFNPYNFLFFEAPLALASLAMGVALWKIFRFLKGNTAYAAPMTPAQLFDYYNGGTDKEESFLHTKHVMAKSLSDAVDKNIAANEKRLINLISCQKFAVIAVPFIIFSSVKYFHSSYTQKPSVVDVNIVNPLDQMKGNANVQSIRLIERQACFQPNTEQTSSARSSSSGTADTISPRSHRKK